MAETFKKVLGTAAGGAVALTLMACYGAAYPMPMEVAEPTGDCSGPESNGQDIDGDGWCEADCDETNPAIFPGGDDPPGDGIDGDCDGKDGPGGEPMTMAE